MKSPLVEKKGAHTLGKGRREKGAGTFYSRVVSKNKKENSGEGIYGPP